MLLFPRDPTHIDRYYHVDDMSDSQQFLLAEAVDSLVDSLPELHRTVVEGVMWEQMSKTQLGVRLKIGRYKVAKVFNEAMAMIRMGMLLGWVGGTIDDVGLPSATLPPTEPEQSEPCGYPTEWGPCRQPQHDGGWCRYHQAAENNPRFTVDRYYHRKVALGMVEHTSEYISQTELDALFGGRPRLDGRRIDQWTT